MCLAKRSRCCFLCCFFCFQRDIARAVLILFDAEQVQPMTSDNQVNYLFEPFFFLCKIVRNPFVQLFLLLLKILFLNTQSEKKVEKEQERSGGSELANQNKAQHKNMSVQCFHNDVFMFTFGAAKKPILSFGDIQNSFFFEFITWLRRKCGQFLFVESHFNRM